MTEFDKILDRPDCTAENCCAKMFTRPCQILSNSVKFLQARSRNFPKSVKRQLRQFELQTLRFAQALLTVTIMRNLDIWAEKAPVSNHCSSNRPLKAKMEFGNIWKNLTRSCKNLTSTRKNLTEFDKILDRPDCTSENSCSKICSSLCQILSNSVKFLQARAEIFQSLSNVSYVDLSSKDGEIPPSHTRVSLFNCVVVLSFR